MTGALIASAVIGGASAVYSSNKADKAAKRGEALSKQSLALQQRQQMFDENRYMEAEGEYQKWKSIYGPLQEDLGTYYKNLTGKQLSNREVIRIQDASQKAKEKIKAHLAQSGRADSGLEHALLAKVDYDAEIQKAESVSTAEERVVNAKTKFLSLGLNQANIIKGQQANASASMRSGVNAQGNILAGQANAERANAAAQGSIWTNYAGEVQGLLGYGARMYTANNANKTDDVLEMF